MKHSELFCYHEVFKMNQEVKFFGQITKINDEERTVEGYASTEAVDSDGEVVTKAAMRQAMDRYMSLPGGGNLREMHQASAVGKVPIMKEDKKGFQIVAKVVDDNAWNKVKELVYTGFSIGGKKLMQKGNQIKELVLSEISLVDRPANPEAVFSLIKLDNLDKENDMADNLEKYVLSEGQEEMSTLMMAYNCIVDMIQTETVSGENVKYLQKALDALKEHIKLELDEPVAAPDMEMEMAEKTEDIEKKKEEAKEEEAVEEETVDEPKAELTAEPPQVKDMGPSGESPDVEGEPEIIVDEVKQCAELPEGLPDQFKEMFNGMLDRIVDLENKVKANKEEEAAAATPVVEPVVETPVEPVIDNPVEVAEAQKVEASSDIVKADLVKSLTAENAELKERLTKLENTPRPTKTQTFYAVEKFAVTNDEEVQKIDARMAELMKIKADSLENYQTNFMGEAMALLTKKNQLLNQG
jgi:hypothetical protein